MITLSNLYGRRESNQPFSVLSLADALWAKLADQAEIDVFCIDPNTLMRLQGHRQRAAVTFEEVLYHTRCVQAAQSNALIMAQLPPYADLNQQALLQNISALLRVGAQMIMLEGDTWLSETVENLARRQIPVCVRFNALDNALSFFSEPNETLEEQAPSILEQVLLLEQAGAAMIMLEHMPIRLMRQLRDALSVPVIGNQCGNEVDGQWMDLIDLLKLENSKASYYDDDDELTPQGLNHFLLNFQQAVLERNLYA